MRTFLTMGLTLLAAIVLAGGADAQSIKCRGGLKPRQVAELLFGRRIGDHGVVSEGAWRRFLAREVTPRFPDGLTVFAAHGQWRDSSSKRIIREQSNVVLVVLPGRAEDQSRLGEIASAYKRQFRQQSVGIIVRQACISF
jgi:hypothetical protein